MQTADFDHGAVSMRLRRGLPACEEVRGTPQTLVLGLHLDDPAWVGQRRAGTRHEAEFRPGELTVIPPGLDCECTTRGPVSFLHLEIDEAALGRPAAWTGPRFQFEDELIQGLSLAALSEARAAGPAASLHSESLAVLILARLDRLDGRPGKSPSDRAPQLGRPMLLRLAEFMRSRLDEPPALAELAALASVGPDHFGRLFRQSTGLTPYRYFQALRMAEARRRLSVPGARVIDVAVSLGFSNPSQFALAFRKVMGINPRALLR